MSTRLANTNDLVRINNWATQVFNRYLSAEVVDTLDAQGTHVVSDTMVHDHAHGYRTAPHLRCQVLLKTKGSKEPVVTYLDMTFEDFESLPSADSLLRDVRVEI